MNIEAMFQAIDAKLESSILRVSGERSISLFGVVCHLHNLGKSIHKLLNCALCTIKILQNF